MSSRIDPGIKVKELGGLYISFDGGKAKAASSSLQQLKRKKIQDEVSSHPRMSRSGGSVIWGLFIVVIHVVHS